MAASTNMNIVFPSSSLRERILENRSSPASSPSPPVVHFEPTENASPQNKASPQKKMKKKKKWSGDRSSLNSRYKKPKVGTRKYQRWLNEVYLNHDWTTLAEEMNHNQEAIDAFEVNEECLSRPNFSFFLDEMDPQRAEEMFDFWYGGSSFPADFCSPEEEGEDALEEEEEGNKAGDKGEREVDEELERFWKIPRLARRAVARSCHSLFLQELEEDLTSYLLWLGKRIEGDEGAEEEEALAVGNDWEEEEFVCNSVTYDCVLKLEGKDREGWGELEFLFPDSLTRFLAHSVCRYYGLSSRSWGKEGNRRTSVYLSSRRGVPAPPSVSLRNFVVCSSLNS